MATIRVLITRAGQPHKGEVVTLDMEDYLVGVVSSEMSEAWPMQALMAQAVAARTFATAHLRDGGSYDVDDTTKYQAYRYRKPGLCPNIEKACKATAGMVLSWGGKLITAYYAASNGGKFADSSSTRAWVKNAATNIEPYKTAAGKADPWTKASGYKYNGHGLGMSQRGAQYAANNGVSWREILAFYYPGCVIAGDSPAAPEQPTTDSQKPGFLPDLKLMTPNMSGADVAMMQRLLQARGYGKDFIMSALGEFGPRTDRAVREFQADHGLPVTGVCDTAMWAKLLPELTLKSPNMKGEEVALMQRRLQAKGYGKDFITSAIGEFGPRTDRAVREFQADHGLAVNGICDFVMWGLLLAA